MTVWQQKKPEEVGQEQEKTGSFKSKREKREDNHQALGEVKGYREAGEVKEKLGQRRTREKSF